MKILFAISTFYEHFSQEMVENAISFFTKETINITHFIKQNYTKTQLTQEIELTTITTKGSLELPQIISFALEKTKYEGICVFGVIKKGKTTHDYFVASEAHSGINQLALKYNIPITTAIINSESEELIKQRTSKEGFNVGFQAAKTCFELIKLKELINK